MRRTRAGGRPTRPSRVRICRELPRDGDAIREVLRRAFPSDAEARVVEVLRAHGAARISLVAEHDVSGVIGQILFTRVEIRSESDTSRALGLGPVAVLPSLQGEGVGSALVEAGLAACRSLGELVVVVLGHPSYYPRFGFEPAWSHGLYYGAAGPNPAFMVCGLEPGALDGRSGGVVYHEAFGRGQR